MEQKCCISSLTLEQLAAELKALGQPGFRAKQIFHWVHQKLVTEFSAMTDQPKTLLATLEEHFYIAAPQIERRQEAKDGTVKYLLRMADGNCIETVVMRYHYGNTVCVSTQVGCRMGCRFCASTQAGRVRNLEADVYKRQAPDGRSHLRPAPRPSGRTGGTGCQPCCRGSCGCPRSAPVSYTHLDVYKRQGDESGKP